LNTLDIRKLAFTAIVGIIGVLGTGTMAAAQHNDDHDKNNGRSNKQWEKQNKQNAKAERERARLMQQRQADWARYNNQLLISHQRQVTYNTRNTQGVAVTFGTNNNNWDQNARYRVYRNGSYYNTDYRGAQLLQQAVNEGYRQGFQAGRNDRNRNVRYSWSNSSVYRSGTYGYQSQVTRNQYQYYFQQGFQRGYQDGSNSRFDNDYNGQYEYGYYENGSLNILGTILNTVLNIRSY
jgi:hypothetical protein